MPKATIEKAYNLILKDTTTRLADELYNKIDKEFEECGFEEDFGTKANSTAMNIIYAVLEDIKTEGLLNE